MTLPTNLELLHLFAGFLSEAGLSAVSIKNYLSDIRHFLAFCKTTSQTDATAPSVSDIFQSLSKYVELYVKRQRDSYTPENSISRRLASVRRFSSFLTSKYGLESSSEFTEKQTPKEDTLSKLVIQYRQYLEKEKKSHSTIKNYVSDINHFIEWSAKTYPFESLDLSTLISRSTLSAYINYLKLTQNSTSLINRHQSSIKSFAQFLTTHNYLPQNPFENKPVIQKLAPLSWLTRNSVYSKNVSTNPRLATVSRLYKSYNSLPFTPYLHLAILALASAAIAIFGYNQIIRQAFPGLAANPTSLQAPRRQLSFQGRLTDSGGTPIANTPVNVSFRLYNQAGAQNLPSQTYASGGTQLYSSADCTVTPDDNGVFNTLIGDGVCGDPIPPEVFANNVDVFLEIHVGLSESYPSNAGTLYPRQQIATVGYALNSLTLQGYPASASAVENTVPVLDNSGNINIGSYSPSIISTSGNFGLDGQALTFTTTFNSENPNVTNNDITFAPDQTTQGRIVMIGGTSTENFLNILNSNLTTGALIYGNVANDTDGGSLILLVSGGTESFERFRVATNGQLYVNADSASAAAQINQMNNYGDIFTASAGGTPRFVITNPGSVGIGVSNPLYKLSVAAGTDSYGIAQVDANGMVRASTYLDASSNGGFRAFDSDGNQKISLTSDGASFLNGGSLGVGIVPQTANFFQVTPTIYSTGTAYQSGTTISGIGTTWTADMVGKLFVFNESSVAPRIITGFNSPTSLTVAESASIGSIGSALTYYIAVPSITVDTTGRVGINTTTMTGGTGSVDFRVDGNADFTGDVFFSDCNDFSTITSSSLNSGNSNGAVPNDVNLGCFYIDANGNARFNNLQVSDTANYGVLVGNTRDGGFVRIGAFDFGSNDGNYNDGGSTSTDGIDTLTIRPDERNLDAVINLRADTVINGALTLVATRSGDTNTTRYTFSAAAPVGTIAYSADDDRLYIKTDGPDDGKFADNAWHRIAMDMTKYSSTSAEVTNQSYIEINHGQNTNDLLITAWVQDKISGLWKKVLDVSNNVLHALDNVFNPLYDQKKRVASFTLSSADLDYGSGKDGAITISSNTNINTAAISSNTPAGCGDAANYSVNSMSATSAVLSTAVAGCITPGDEVLVINLMGRGQDILNVGNYETVYVSAVSGTSITFASSLTKFYGSPGGFDNIHSSTADRYRVMIQRVPHYTNVTVDTSASFAPSAFDGSKGGVLFFRANGTVAVNSGSIDANGVGYAGGVGSTTNGTVAAKGGLGPCGTKAGSGGVVGTNSVSAGTTPACGGGGGGAQYSSTYTGAGGNDGTSVGAGDDSPAYGRGGGGGGGAAYHATAGSARSGAGAGGGYGTPGAFGQGGVNGTSGDVDGVGGAGGAGITNGQGGGGGGGGSYGVSNLSKIYLGSGGGAGGANQISGTTYPGKNGGAGGGIVIVSAKTVTVAGSISSNGGAGVAGTTNVGGGGGGAGGSVKVTAGSMNIGTSLVTASGGTASTTPTRDGGVGGDGLIALFSDSTITGTTLTTSTSSTTANYQDYGIFVSKEINTPNTIQFNTLSWSADVPTGSTASAQVRFGDTADSTDGSWSDWYGGGSAVVQSMNSAAEWGGTLADSNNGITRTASYFEDENEAVVANMTKFTTQTNRGGYSSTTTLTTTDLRPYDYLSAWIYATGAGQVVQLGFTDNSVTQSHTFTIDTANTWQKVYWDLRNIADANKDALTSFSISALSGQTLYVDNIKAEKLLTNSAGSNINFTTSPKQYIQYRYVISTYDSTVKPTVSNIAINLDRKNLLTDAATINQTIDASSTYTVGDIDRFTSSRVTATETDLTDSKSYRTNISQTAITQRGDYDPGTGADGDIAVIADTDINTTSLIAGRSCADGGDAVNYSITAFTPNTATLITPPSAGCLSIGDEVLLINLQGTATAFDNVGNYETLRISGITGNVVTFTTSKSNFYGDGDDDSNLGIVDGTQRVMLQRVPNYHNVTVASTKNFTPSAWNGAKNGVMFFRASGSVSVSGSINANALGYRANGTTSYVPNGGESFVQQYAGGQGSCNSGLCGVSGKGTNGIGGGGGGIFYDERPATTGSNTGGAGGAGGSSISTSAVTRTGGGGGGGGYGTAGKGGMNANQYLAAQDGSTNQSGNGGIGITDNSGAGGGGGGGSYGTADLSKLMFGSSGGSGGYGQNNGPTRYSGSNGGNGGGIVLISAGSITVSGSLGSIGNAGVSNSNGYSGGGGGGAGGSVKLSANNINLGTSLVSVSGGIGGTANNNREGGDGGEGRIAIYYATSISGSAAQTPYAASVPAYNYGVYISDELHTPDATQYNALRWVADLDSYGLVEFQTRSGRSSDSTDGTWEEWRPSTASATTTKVLNSANTTTGWSEVNLTVDAGNAPLRNVNYYEDEDQTETNIRLSSVGSPNGYSEATITSISLENYDYITAWVYATTSGNIVQLGFGETTGTEQSQIFNIDASNTWQKLYWDISDVPAGDRDAITKIRVSVLSTNTTINFDNFSAARFFTDGSGTSLIKSTPNEYIQYRAILTTTNPAYHPSVFNIQVNWNTGYKVEQVVVDSKNTVRLSNFSGETQNLRLDAIVLGADLAEWYTVEDPSIGPGDLVSMTGNMDEFRVPILKKADKANDPRLLGVISTNAGQTLGLEADNRRLLGLAGRLPVNMDPASPDVLAGQKLTSSNIPGKAKLAQPGDITIGVALENWLQSDHNPQVTVLINNQNSSSSISSIDGFSLAKTQDALLSGFAVVNASGDTINAVGAFSKAIIGNLEAGAITAKEIAVDTLTVKEMLLSPLAEIGDLVVSNDATISGTLHADNIESKSLDNKFETIDAKYATASAILAELQAKYSTYASLMSTASDSSELLDIAYLPSDNASISAQIPSDLILDTLLVNSSLFSNSLNSSDGDLYIQPIADRSVHLLANLMTLTPEGKVFINGSLTIAGNITAQSANFATLSVGSNKNASESGFGKILALFNENGDLVGSVDASGAATFNSLETNELIIAAAQNTNIAGISTASATTNASIGVATIATGSAQVTIANTKVDSSTLVYLTPISDTDNQVLWVSAKQTGIGFTVTMNQPLTHEVQFNYWLVKTK